MFACALATVVQLSLIAPAADSYAEAHQTVVKDGRPMVVMVGTEWCPPCQRMKRQVLPMLRQRPVFRRIAFAVVNADEQRELARQITGGGPVPQLVMFRKGSKGWLRRKLVGGQQIDTVEKFIEQGVELAESEQDSQQAKVKPAEDAESDSRRSGDAGKQAESKAGGSQPSESRQAAGGGTSGSEPADSPATTPAHAVSTRSE